MSQFGFSNLASHSEVGETPTIDLSSIGIVNTQNNESSMNFYNSKYFFWFLLLTFKVPRCNKSFLLFLVDNNSDSCDGTKKRKKKSRWAGGDNEKIFIPGMPTILPAGMTQDQQEAYLGKFLECGSFHTWT